eukprot:CAMPEP_0183732868 /NCGR_PEP_ID=MMETSP0737-20130205/39567_1 /TAXON_ID=385413 /ORGANISM="Thalassiosira miniscula, Strain CCMP1093" /LENGTH=381 /DNA_ID=CAMNT_0025965993 /DNA_START=147 /DNA_END=1292 /DNA_ORIENTATION=-
MRHVRSYLNGTSILNLAKRCNYPPSMMARLIVENVAAPPSPPPPPPPTANTNTATSASVQSGNTNSGNTNINPKKEGGGNGKNNNKNHAAASTNSKKFVTEALRHPEKLLGCASSSILPEYLFSEKNHSGGANNATTNATRKVLTDGFSGKPLYEADRTNKAITDDASTQYPTRQQRSLMPLSRLCLEVREAIDSDPMYGPRQDKERHNIGIEYELLLEQTLQSMDIPFETEAELRVRGTARTPDILLSCPVGIKVRKRRIQHHGGGGSSSNPLYMHGVHSAEENDDDDEDDGQYEWKVICWIDSKALFGDIETHTNNVLPQVETYVHRFGPGLVLYWFGHAPLERLGDGHGDVVILGGNLPEVVMMPTGDYHGKGGRRIL